MAVLKSYTLFNNNFFNSSFENNKQITSKALSYGLDS
jgi:hypothetical protein